VAGRAGRSSGGEGGAEVAFPFGLTRVADAGRGGTAGPPGGFVVRVVVLVDAEGTWLDAVFGLALGFTDDGTGFGREKVGVLVTGLEVDLEAVVCFASKGVCFMEDKGLVA